MQLSLSLGNEELYGDNDGNIKDEDVLSFEGKNPQNDFGSFSFEDMLKCLEGLKKVRVDILKFFREKEPGALVEAFSNEILENDSVMNIFVSLDNEKSNEHLFLRGNRSCHTDDDIMYDKEYIQDIIFDALTNKHSPWSGPLLMEHEAKLYLMVNSLEDENRKKVLSLFKLRNRYSDEIYQRMLPKLKSLSSNLVNIERDFNGNNSPCFNDVFSVACTSFFSLLNVFDMQYGIRFFFGMVEQGVRRAIKEFLIEHRYCVKVPPGKILSNSINSDELPSARDVEIIDVFSDRIEVSSGVMLTSGASLENNTNTGEVGHLEIDGVENDVIKEDFAKKLLKIEAIFSICSRRFGGKKKALEKHNRLLQEIERYCYGR